MPHGAPVAPRRAAKYPQRFERVGGTADIAQPQSDVQALIAAADVLGQGFTFEQLCRVADIAEGDGLLGLDEVLRGRLLRE